MKKCIDLKFVKGYYNNFCNGSDTKSNRGIFIESLQSKCIIARKLNKTVRCNNGDYNGDEIEKMLIIADDYFY